MELRPSLKMGKSKCAKSPISYLTTAPPEFETFKLLLMAVALPYYEMGKFGPSAICFATILLSHRVPM